MQTSRPCTCAHRFEHFVVVVVVEHRVYRCECGGLWDGKGGVPGPHLSAVIASLEACLNKINCNCVMQLSSFHSHVLSATTVAKFDCYGVRQLSWCQSLAVVPCKGPDVMHLPYWHARAMVAGKRHRALQVLWCGTNLLVICTFHGVMHLPCGCYGFTGLFWVLQLSWGGVHLSRCNATATVLIQPATLSYNCPFCHALPDSKL